MLTSMAYVAVLQRITLVTNRTNSERTARRRTRPSADARISNSAERKMPSVMRKAMGR
jgi:hypothetical protein